ncbi:ROK family transcriptional regulator [Alicyclobacillus dauci]|uniref:ROK family transcriptional regulator n=1 Tax=Alicyclobacillus dauci TaxID=1475485 RepID=A0ABY6YZQ5_9BACL|nr:ROK family transcriptional regulator [Alicyclobacillus dauci]WAH36061.1 ROK family transcriptional regulator [Alicyclobacillus dauci]
MRTGTIVRNANRTSVLELIRMEEPISRAGIAKELKMSRSAVSEIVDLLVSEGLVREVGTGNSTQRGGRPSVQLRFVPTARYSFGIDIGGTKTIFLLADLSGHVVASRKMSSHAEGVDSLEHIRSEAERFLSSLDIAREKIVGTGVGAPGVTNYESGVVVAAPGLGWNHVNVKEAFERTLPGPVFVDNDVNMAVIGETWKGRGANYRNVVLVTVGTGIGAGIMMNGTVHRGAQGYAGEIGYFVVDPLAEGKNELESFGALDRLASGSGIESQAAAMLADYPDSLLHGQDITSEQVFAAASKADPLATRVVKTVENYVAYALMNIVALLNPDVVILGGGVAQSGEAFLSAIQSRVRDLMPIPVTVVGAALGENAGALGAAATVLLETNHLKLNSRQV